ncbi:hypothetical protein HY441_01070 [Candidatus Microgenomates bacterium]|nr:hypothetical protein [Candidatus Microgenomates bacterium]
MINILPPDIKQQINYSKRNVRLLRYLLLSALVLGLVLVLVGGSYIYANRQIKQLEKTLATRQQERQDYKDIEAKVQTLQSNLGLIEKLFTEKTKFSVLLNDLSAVLPDGSYINEITLTGDDKKPLEMIVTVDSFNKAAETRNALIQSARIKSADIQTITKNDAGSGFSVEIVAAFESGQAR